MSVPDFSDIARQIFDDRPADVEALRRICDETDALRAQLGEDDPRVQDGERRANALKGMFARRIAWACHLRDMRFGLRAKTTGQIATRPVDGRTLSTDALMLNDTGQIVDCMSDRNPMWGVTPGDTQPLEQWVAPLPEPGDAQPGPLPPTMPPPEPPQPPAPTGDLASVLAAIAALDAKVQQLLDRPAPTYQLKMPYLGTVTLTPNK